MDKYIVIKKLPDASVGTEVIWDENANAFYYKKNCWVSPHDKNYLSFRQVTQTPEYFCSERKHTEYFAYNYPVYSRKEILELLKECFPDKNISGSFNLSVSNEIHNFEIKLKDLGMRNAKKLM